MKKKKKKSPKKKLPKGYTPRKKKHKKEKPPKGKPWATERKEKLFPIQKLLRQLEKLRKTETSLDEIAEILKDWHKNADTRLYSKFLHSLMEQEKLSSLFYDSRQFSEELAFLPLVEKAYSILEARAGEIIDQDHEDVVVSFFNLDRKEELDQEFSLALVEAWNDDKPFADEVFVAIMEQFNESGWTKTRVYKYCWPPEELFVRTFVECAFEAGNKKTALLWANKGVEGFSKGYPSKASAMIYEAALMCSEHGDEGEDFMYDFLESLWDRFGEKGLLEALQVYEPRVGILQIIDDGKPSREELAQYIRGIFEKRKARPFSSEITGELPAPLKMSKAGDDDKKTL